VLFRSRILRRIVAALAAEGIDYRGVVYAGLMITREGPKVLEFNCRFGDPETQVILPRLASDLGAALLACADGSLEAVDGSPDAVDGSPNAVQGGRGLAWRTGACVGVVLASGGYPGPFPTGVPIAGLSDAAAVPGAVVFHAGTARREGRVVTAGGRVLTIAAEGSDLAAARASAYESAALIGFDGMSLRRDIAAAAAGDMTWAVSRAASTPEGIGR